MHQGVAPLICVLYNNYPPKKTESGKIPAKINDTGVIYFFERGSKLTKIIWTYWPSLRYRHPPRPGQSCELVGAVPERQTGHQGNPFEIYHVTSSDKQL